jgi:hypothetical protein
LAKASASFGLAKQNTGNSPSSRQREYELTVEQAAETLGVTTRHIYRCRAGDQPIPPTVANLCEALDALLMKKSDQLDWLRQQPLFRNRK